jgi:Chaperone of endosialidase
MRKSIVAAIAMLPVLLPANALATNLTCGSNTACSGQIIIQTDVATTSTVSIENSDDSGLGSNADGLDVTAAGNGNGITASSTNWNGIKGQTAAGSGTIYAGVLGEATVSGGTGVVAVQDHASGAALAAFMDTASTALSGGYGIYSSTGGSNVAVYGTSASGNGVHGISGGGSGYNGVWGANTANGTGVYGVSSGSSRSAGVGVWGVDSGSSGTNGSGGYFTSSSGEGSGVSASCSGGSCDGIYATCSGTSCYAGEFEGNVYVSGALTVNSCSGCSDLRMKKNVKPLSGALDQLLQLREVTFEWIDPAKDHHEREIGTQAGFIAQDLEKIRPEWVNPEGYRSKDGATYRTIDLHEIEALEVGSIRQLKSENDTLKAENADLRARMSKVEDRLDVITNGRDPISRGPGFGGGTLAVSLAAVVGLLIAGRKREKGGA